MDFCITLLEHQLKTIMKPTTKMMKSVAIAAFILLILPISASAQSRLDVFGGYSPSSTPGSADLLVNRQTPHEEFMFNMVEVAPQYFVGAKGHVNLAAPFFAEAGLTYTMRKSTYRLEYTMVHTDRATGEQFLSETDHMIMLPVNIGVNLGSFDVTSGFRAITSLSRKSELTDIAGFNMDNNKIRIGWQGGIGYYILRSRIGIEYQGCFSRVGSGRSVNGQSLELMNTGCQFVFNIQQSF